MIKIVADSSSLYSKNEGAEKGVIQLMGIHIRNLKI